MGWRAKITPAEMLMAAILLVGAVGLGIGVRHIMKVRASLNEQPKPVAQSPQKEPVRIQEEAEPPRPASPVPEAVPQVVEQPVEGIDPAEQLAPPMGPGPVMQPFTDQPPMGGAGQMDWGGTSEIWQRAFSDLQMTPEEQERFQQGMGIAMQRFWGMSESERQEETERMRQMGDRWQAMSEPEREAAIGRIRQRFEDWRNSDAIELPPPSLD